MIYTPLTVKAINLASRAHLNRLDENKLPEIFFVYSVASKTKNEYSFCVAMLFLAVEMKYLSFKRLKRDFPFEITDAINMLITDDSLSYPDYIRRIKTNELASQVKVIELEEKLALLNISKDKRMVAQKKEKYSFALNILFKNK
ncbi:MAG: hypothetical protein GX149_00480 [Acholeplasmataceae bacterium]|jgi:hypothetical protein|nr:hypothetical protein [Acholeplasmataceae bacterium]